MSELQEIERLTDALEQADNRIEALEAALKETPEIIPNSWLDPLLSVDCSGIEKLFRTLRFVVQRHVDKALQFSVDSA